MRKASTLAVLGILLGAAVAHAQQQPDPNKVTIKTTKLADGIYMLDGAGGNIGVSVGEDGVVLIDDQYASLSPKILAAVKAISPKPIKFVINTHWHGDHTSGNENMAATGAVIVAHDNVRKRLSTGQFIEMIKKQVPPAPPKALPVVTFASDITLHLNGEDLHVIHVNPAHTDGDSIIVFPKAKVVHMGDCYMTISYPFVDAGSGGNFDGFISATEKALELMDDTFKIIPGHGVPSTKADLKTWHDMLTTIRARVKKEIDGGKSLDAIKAAKLTSEWDARWGVEFIKPDMIVESAYAAIKGTH